METFIDWLMWNSLREFVLFFEMKSVLQILFFIFIFTGSIYPSFSEYLEQKKIQDKEAPERQHKFERKYIWRNLLLIPLVSAPVIYLLYKYWLYEVNSSFDVVRIVLNILFLIVLSDTYFYRTHRAMHGKAVYGKIHAVHHASLTPTAHTSLSFDVWEVIVNFSFLVWYSLLMIMLTWDIHFISVSIYILIFNFWNTYIHSWSHVNSEAMRKSWRWKHIAWSEWHDNHHEHNAWNYALYFKFWDQVCGTVCNKKFNTSQK